MSRSQTRFEYEERGNVVVWDMTAWSGDPDELGGSEEEWLDVIGQPHIDGVVTVYSDDLTLGPEAQAHIEENWSETNADFSLDIERSALVSDGIKAMAIGANIEAESYELETFDDVDAAVEWARG